MVNYNSIEEMMNTTENMSKVVDNTGYDDTTLAFDGVDWFVFNGKAPLTINVSGNSWIGLGTTSMDLQVCQRDGKLWNLFLEEATILHYYHVFKIRWEGYSYYKSTSSSYALKYEWFLVDNGDMFLNMITVPSSSSYMGMTMVAGGYNQTFSISTGKPKQIAFYHQDETGTLFEAVEEVLQIAIPFDIKYLLSDKDGIFYTSQISETEDGETITELVALEVNELNAEVFRSYGMDEMPTGEIMLQLINPSMYYWQDWKLDLPIFDISAIAVPKPQTVVTNNCQMIHSTILGVENMEIIADDETLFAFSFDAGKTWMAYVNDAWVELTEETSGINRVSVEAIGTDAWNEVVTDRQYMIRFTLFEGGYVERITINYLN